MGRADDAKDLDIWCEDGRQRQEFMRAVEEHLPAARVEHTDDPRRLQPYRDGRSEPMPDWPSWMSRSVT